MNQMKIEKFVQFYRNRQTDKLFEFFLPFCGVGT